MSLPQVIGLYAPCMHSGKSTIADLLCSQYGYQRVKFAETIKAMAAVFLHDLGIPAEEIDRHIEGDLKETKIEPYGVSVRRILQTLGYEWGQEYLGPDVWVRIAIGKIARIVKAGGHVVVDDLRYPQEFKALEERGSCLVMVARAAAANRTIHHRSEGLLNNHPFTRVISNDGTIEDLEKRVDQWMQSYSL